MINNRKIDILQVESEKRMKELVLKWKTAMEGNRVQLEGQDATTQEAVYGEAGRQPAEPFGQVRDNIEPVA